MATVVDEAFESGLGAYSTSGTAPTTGAAAAHAGAAGLIVTTASGVPSHILRSLPAGLRAHTFRFYFRFVQDTSGVASVYQADCTTGTFVIQARPGLKLRIYVGGTVSADSAAMTLNQWYLIDGRFVSSGTTATGDLRVDTLPLTQVTHLQAAADQSLVRIGNTATNTYIIHVDDWKLTDVATDYPLGAPITQIVNAHPELAAGTGAMTAGAPSMQATAGRPTGTGLTWGAISADLVMGSQKAIGQAFAISNDIESIVTPTAGRPTGTGTSYQPGRSSSPSIGRPTGTGAAAAAATSLRATSGISSGTGAAANATGAPAVSVAGALASGTGAGANSAVVVAVQAVPGMTLTMGVTP